MVYFPRGKQSPAFHFNSEVRGSFGGGVIDDWPPRLSPLEGYEGPAEKFLVIYEHGCGQVEPELEKASLVCTSQYTAGTKLPHPSSSEKRAEEIIQTHLGNLPQNIEQRECSKIENRSDLIKTKVVLKEERVSVSRESIDHHSS